MESENLKIAMTVFMQYYAPAKSLSESDEQQSTLDIAYNLRDFLTTKEISIPEINKHMLKHGYILKYFGTGYVWLLNIKRNNTLQ